MHFSEDSWGPSGGRRGPNLLPEAGHPWRQGLAEQWWARVAAPRVFEVAVDYEVAAERVLGRDDEGDPCYCHYQCVLTEVACDDGDEFFEDLAYAEDLRAWRLDTGAWLVRRAVTTAEAEDVERVEFCTMDTMPR